MSQMSTSLADQLRRLKTAQTSLLTDSKKRASLLFSAKEAAEKDRETIFDIGYSGFQDLITLNPSFLQFESSLFDKNARELQRAVENKKVNRQLKEVIKKFLIHLSPYLLLQPTHKCLEWLIRRFNINEYEKTEFMALILPYHETTIFVKCLQTMNLRDPSDLWHWLEPVKKNGVPLSKQALLNRVASDSFLMSFICESIVYAVNELDTWSHTLQVYYAFFCTSVIGALDIAKINESHIKNIYAAVRKGVKSTSLDFCAASLMIIGQLVNKVKLKPDILNSFVNMLLEKVTHVKLQQDVVILLVLIYRNQSETIDDISEECLTKLLVNIKWLPPVLAKIYSEEVNILPFYLPLLSTCLKHIQLKSSSWKKRRKFCDLLLSEIFFKPEHAESVIRCTLDSFILTEKLDDSTIVEIESGNEDEEMETSDKGITSWYTNTLKALERRYPSTFDAIVKEIVRSDNRSMSELKKRSLKKVLSFLFTIVCADDNVNLFEKLYHYNAQQRVEAIKYLVQNLSKMSFSDDSKSLLKDSIAERLSDDSSIVVKETLKLGNNALLRFMGKTELIKKYVHILENTLKDPNAWEHTALETIKYLGELCSQNLPVQILVAILPLLLQPSALSARFLRKVFNSDLSNHVEFVKACKEAIASISDDKEAITKSIYGVFESEKRLPSLGSVLQFIQTLKDEELTLNKAFYSMLLLSHSCSGKIDIGHKNDVLNVINKYQKQFKMSSTKDSSKWTTLVAKGQYPVNIHIATTKKLIDSLAGTEKEFKDKPIEFNKSKPILLLWRRIFEYFISGMSRNQSKFTLFEDGVKYFFEKLLQNPEKRIEFLSNYFTIDVLSPELEAKSIALVSIEHQVFIINYVNTLLQSQDGDLNGVEIQLEPFIRILTALRSPDNTVREAAYETLVVLKSTNQPKFKTLIAKLIRRQNEILMDDNQLPLILFKIFDKKSSNELNSILMEFVELIATTKDNEFLVSQLLEALTHVNNEDILKSIATTAMNILTNAAEEMTKTTRKTLYLDTFNSIIMRNILSRYTQQTIPIIKKVSSTWQVLLKSSESYGILLKGTSKETSITNIVVDVFNNDLFNELSIEHQCQLIAALVNSATYAENGNLYTSINKFFKQVHLNARVCLNILNEMAKMDQPERMDIDEVSTNIRQRRSSQCASDGGISAELLKSKSWKQGVTWLEFLQNKREINNPHLLISPLFAVLQKCLQFEDQSNVEYVKQLSLACLHHLCVTIAPDGKVPGKLITEKNFKIESVVQCIRGTQNPQTHHHALQLLSHSARMLPEQVLHNMMDIFTFMGSSVVRHDDVYSFQIITNIISSIIPTLTRINENKSEAERNALVVPVLKVFADIILDVPEHRRLPLYTKLLDTLNADNYLWMFLAILIESYIIHHQLDVEKSNRPTSTLTVDAPQRIDIALALMKEFSCKTIITTTTELIKFLQKLPINQPTNESDKIPTEISVLFNIIGWTRKQFRRFKYEMVKFVNDLTQSVEFVNKVAVLKDDDATAMKEHYQDAIISILTYIPIISKAAEYGTENTHSDYWKALLHNCFDVLGNVISLLSSNVLLVVVHGLLSHKLSSVRRRIIELLINKLQHSPEIFSDENEAGLVSLLEPLTKIIESIIDEKKLIQNASSAENTSIQQMSLMAAKILSKQLAEKYPKNFKHIVETLIDVLRKSEKVPRILLATVLLCLCEICANLRVHSIVYLPSFMKIFLELLKGFSQPENVSNDNVLICLVAGLLKVVGTLALYLSPYLVEMIVHLSQIWHNIETEQTKDPKRNSIIVERLNGIWEKLSTILELRILIPTIDQSYKRLMDNEHSTAIGPLMQLMTQTLEHQTAGNISRFMPDITSFFIRALQFRCDHSDIEFATVNDLEAKIIKSFRVLALKLSEGSFRPLYYRIYEWAIKQSGKDLDHTITYFRLSVEMAKSLKSLYVLFANDFIDDVPELLNKSLASEMTNPSDVLQQKTRLLIDSVVETLHQVFLHDNRNFMNGARFEAILQPLTDQIENEIVLDSTKSMDLISSCLAQLGHAVNDDIQWKQLNYQILMKTRNNESRIRLFALKVVVNLAAKLGEDYMPLLPETVPFISELLEDENPEVEKECQLSVQELETILGEPLQKYF